jgi:hypothetical protein
VSVNGRNGESAEPRAHDQGQELAGLSESSLLRKPARFQRHSAWHDAVACHGGLGRHYGTRVAALWPSASTRVVVAVTGMNIFRYFPQQAFHSWCCASQEIARIEVQESIFACHRRRTAHTEWSSGRNCLPNPAAPNTASCRRRSHCRSSAGTNQSFERIPPSTSGIAQHKTAFRCWERELRRGRTLSEGSPRACRQSEHYSFAPHNRDS